MKSFLFILLTFISFSTFSQNASSISGKVIDLESENNSPLYLASVSIKETGAKVLADENGAFKFEGLENGAYTLVYSFTGYTSKELKTKVSSKKNSTVTLYLEASTISLDDFASVFTSNAGGDKKDKDQALLLKDN